MPTILLSVSNECPLKTQANATRRLVIYATKKNKQSRHHKKKNYRTNALATQAQCLRIFACAFMQHVAK